MQRRIVWALALLLSISSAICQAELPSVPAHIARAGVPLTKQYTLEAASNPGTRMTGLMYRRSLDPDHGMIFVFPSSEKRTFWMKNTYLSLDLLFLDLHGTVQGVIEEAKPLSTAHLELPGEVESRYVVEFAAGTVKRDGIKRGDVFEFESKLPVPESDR